MGEYPLLPQTLCCQFRKGGEGNEKPKDNILTRNLKRYFFHYSEITTPHINQTKRNESNLKQRPEKKKERKKKGEPSLLLTPGSELVPELKH